MHGLGEEAVVGLEALEAVVQDELLLLQLPQVHEAVLVLEGPSKVV